MIFELEYARSGRAACKVCQGKIDKDTLRVGTKLKVDKDKVGDGDVAKMTHLLESTRWHHFRCFPKMRGVKWFKEHLPEPSECSGFEALKEDDREHIAALFGRCRGVDVPLPLELLSPPAGSLQDPITPAMDKKGKGQKRLGENALEAADVEGMSPETKASKTADAKCGLTPSQAAELERQKLELAKKSMAQLGAMLAKNAMSKTGKKEELVDRVAECRILGAWPTCPRCEKARLRFNRDTCAYSCPGNFDEDTKRMLRCKGPPKDAYINRPPWQELFSFSSTEEVTPESTQQLPLALPSASPSASKLLPEASVRTISTAGMKRPSVQTLTSLFQKQSAGTKDDVRDNVEQVLEQQAPTQAPTELLSIELLTCASDLSPARAVDLQAVGKVRGIEEVAQATQPSLVMAACMAAIADPAARHTSLARAADAPPATPRLLSVREAASRVKRSKYFM